MSPLDPNFESRMAAVLANCDRFDMFAFSAWAAALERKADIAKLAKACPPNRIYRSEEYGYVVVTGYNSTGVEVDDLAGNRRGLRLTPGALRDVTDEIRQALFQRRETARLGRRR